LISLMSLLLLLLFIGKRILKKKEKKRGKTHLLNGIYILIILFTIFDELYA
jgi:O-antigen ligase